MIAFLIPFFATTHLAVDDNAWQHGPEYTFLVHMNLSGHIDVSEGILFGSNITTHLVCQPNLPNSLRCHFDDFDVEHYECHLPNNCTSGHFEFGIMTTVPFEINFNDRGIERVTFSKKNHTNIAHYGIITSIASLLNVGVNFTDREGEEFQAMENSTIGECMVNFRVERSFLNEKEHSNLSFELPSYFNKVPGEAIYLKKERNTKKCISYTGYFNGSPPNFNIANMADVNLKSSSNDITITDTRFESNSDLQATIRPHKLNNTIEITESFSLSLVNIGPATGELPIIRDPVTTTILAAGELVDN